MHSVGNDYDFHGNFCCSKTKVQRCNYRCHCYETKAHAMSEITTYLHTKCPDEKDTRATLKED